MPFNKIWENKIYSKGKQLNMYPDVLLVGMVARKFFHIPVSKRKNIKVLDLGCGAGNHSKFFAEKGFDIYGIDGSSSAIEICKKRFKQWNLKGSFKKGDFVALPYKNNFFNLVIDREALYANSFKSIKRAVNEVYNKLKKGGIFISFIYSTRHPDVNLGEKVEMNTYKNFKKESNFYGAGVVHFVDIKEILELYSKFKIKNIIKHSVVEIFNKSKRIMNYDEYIIIAEK